MYNKIILYYYIMLRLKKGLGLDLGTVSTRNYYSFRYSFEVLLTADPTIHHFQKPTTIECTCYHIRNIRFSYYN